MTTEPNLQPLAALLASHPEECAAVVAVLALDGEQRPINIARKLAGHGEQMWVEAVDQVLNACAHAGVVSIDTTGECCLAKDADRYAIARMGSAAWLRERCGTSPRAPRYADREAIAARVAAVLDCRVGDVELDWQSSRLDSIYVRGEGLAGDDIAALIKAGFEPSVLGWDVPGDCGAGAP